ncbi:MAG TPA: DUF3592 domain-containing protein [Reyranella sp.]|nr:DUF3592 domain-containing protein [Reyranella sp.]
MPTRSTATNTAAGRSSSMTTADDAKKMAARYSEGSEVDVHYDPANPGSAALERPTGPAWYLLVIAVLCFGAAAYAGLLWH